AAALLTAFLSRLSEDRVNPVNARAVAAERGITVMEQRSTQASEFSNLVTLIAEGDRGRTRVSGTLRLGEAHIVYLDDFRIDLVPEGTFRMTGHAHRPGVDAALGRLLV